METPISDDGDEGQGQGQDQIQVQQNGAADFGAMPDVQQQQRQNNNVPIPNGSGQGQSSPYVIGRAKEFFNLQSDDFLSIILVFILLLVIATGSINGLMTAGGSMFFANDKLTLIGAITVSIVFSLIYFLVKILGRNFM